MKYAIVPILLLSLAACEKTEVIPIFDDPIAALDIADAAIAANHPKTAEAAFTYALELGGENEVPDALFGLLDVHLRYGNTNQGLVIFDRLLADHADLLTADKLNTLCNMAVNGNMAELGEPMLQLASERFPERQAKWRVIDAEFTRIRTLIENGDLGAIGYVLD